MLPAPIRTRRTVLALAALAACACANTSTRRSAMPDPTQDDNKRTVTKLFETCFNLDDMVVLDQVVSPDYVGPQGGKGPPASARSSLGCGAPSPTSTTPSTTSSPRTARSPFGGIGRARTRPRFAAIRLPTRRSRTRAPGSSGFRAGRSWPLRWRPIASGFCSRWARCLKTSSLRASRRPAKNGNPLGGLALLRCRANA